MCNYGHWSQTGTRLESPELRLDGSAAPAGGWYVQAFTDYAPQQEGELGFRAGDYIQVQVQGEPGGWGGGELKGQAGFFPSNFCSDLTQS